MTILLRRVSLLCAWGLFVSVIASPMVSSASFAAADAPRATFANAVSKVAPAVVNIYTTRMVEQTENPPAVDPMVQNLYGQQPHLRLKAARSLGSGVIVRSSGVVITNMHVIAKAKSVRVGLADGREFDARFIAGDDKTDLAVLQIEDGSNKKLPVAKFGKSATLRVGDVVLALGNPFGIGQSVTMGVVSAVDRTNANLGGYSQFIQTDAAINPGNSGGPLIDSNGAVVGINTAIFTRTGGTMGISFAIPADVAAKVVEDIVTKGSVTRPWLGAEGQAISPALAQRLDQRGGVFLNSIIPGSPADRAGLQPGDLIIALDNKSVTDPADLNERLLAAPNLANTSSTITIQRAGKSLTFPIKLEALPPRNTSSQRQIEGYSPLAGIKVEQLSATLNVEYSLPMRMKGVAVVAVQPAPQGVQQVALQKGDIIRSINSKPVTTVDDVVAISSISKRTWVVQVDRPSGNGQTRALTLQSPR